MVYNWVMAKDASYNCWYEGCPATSNANFEGDKLNLLYQHNKTEPIFIDYQTICLFTGFYDSKNRKIWQNDIVRFYIGDKICHEGLVWWNNEGQHFDFVYLDDFEFNGFDYYNKKKIDGSYELFCLMIRDPWGDFTKIEKVGNIIKDEDMKEYIFQRLKANILREEVKFKNYIEKSNKSTGSRKKIKIKKDKKNKKSKKWS